MKQHLRKIIIVSVEVIYSSDYNHLINNTLSYNNNITIYINKIDL